MSTKNLLFMSLLALGGCGVMTFEEGDLVFSLMRGAGHDKVALCHVPPGNPANAHTIVIGEPAVSHHLANHSGDHLGPCTCEDRGDCDTGDTGWEDTGDTGGDADTDTDSDSDTDTDTDTDTGLYTDTDVIEERTWVQNGCNTAPTGAAFFGMLIPLFIFRRRSA